MKVCPQLERKQETIAHWRCNDNRRRVQGSRETFAISPRLFERLVGRVLFVMANMFRMNEDAHIGFLLDTQKYVKINLWF